MGGVETFCSIFVSITCLLSSVLSPSHTFVPQKAKQDLERNRGLLDMNLAEGDVGENKMRIIKDVITPLRALQIRMLHRSQDVEELFGEWRAQCERLQQEVVEKKAEHFELKKT